MPANSQWQVYEVFPNYPSTFPPTTHQTGFGDALFSSPDSCMSSSYESLSVSSGSNTFLFKSTDHGQNWAANYFGSGQGVSPAIFDYKSPAYYCITSYMGLYTFHKSIDFGMNWQTVITYLSGYLFGYSIVDNDNIYFLRYYPTKTNLDRYHQGQVVTIDSFNLPLPASVCFIDSLTGFIARPLSSSSFDANQIYKTSTGGGQWQLVYSDPQNNHYKMIEFYNARTGVAVSDYGVILMTNDSGNTWQQHFITQSISKINDICIYNDSSFFICGDDGKVFRTNNYCNSFTSYNLPPINKMKRVTVLNDTLVLALAISNYIYGTMYYLVLNATNGISTQDDNNPGAITVFPNPSNGDFSLIMPGHKKSIACEISMYDLNGKIILFQKDDVIDDIISVHKEDILPGVYVLNILYGDRITRRKVVIQ